ncbi:MAG: helix-turn-helix domain-containing protein [Marinobacter sp.]|nr:helix-turn-helix domain-containing protein [Marinobacter sp.]
MAPGVLRRLVFVSEVYNEVRACSSHFFVLEHYLRIATRKPENWLSTLRVLTGSPRLSQEFEPSALPDAFCARMSFLPAESINLCGLYVNSALNVFGLNAGKEAIIMPVEGAVEFKVGDRSFVSAPGIPFVLEPNVEFIANLSPDTHVFIVQMGTETTSDRCFSFENGDLNLGKILDSYLVETPFFKSHAHAVDRSTRFEQALLAYSRRGVSDTHGADARVLVDDDRRLCRALVLINERLYEGIELESIARDSGLSLRNLYYLMKKYTGMTPSGYCRSRRLIKARESLIRNHPEDRRVSGHALKWGFNHLGRFSSYYFEHFGEYPSDTTQCLESMTRHAEQVVSAEYTVAGQKRRCFSCVTTDTEDNNN